MTKKERAALIRARYAAKHPSRVFPPKKRRYKIRPLKYTVCYLHGEALAEPTPVAWVEQRDPWRTAPPKPKPKRRQPENAHVRIAKKWRRGEIWWVG